MKLSSYRADMDPEINLISLIDVLFCLVIFLVVTLPFVQHRSTIKLGLVSAVRWRAS